nr:GntR family transcriptional regulator [uncultured Rhodopila sp.]
MATRVKAEPVIASKGTVSAASRGNRLNLSHLAYEKCEELIVNCDLRPGLFLSIQDIQDATRVGRTPIHQAVSRLAADTLIIVRPRHGLQIAPIDLARERTLLQLRRDMERFVLRLAAERSGPSQRNQFLHLSRTLRARAGQMTVNQFNVLDRRIDHLLGAAAGEPFLEHTLRPLHTIFRRIGLIYHRWVAPEEGLTQTVVCHLDMLDAVAAGRPDAAVAAADRLIGFVDSMFDAMERGIDPGLLDCNLELLAVS